MTYRCPPGVGLLPVQPAPGEPVRWLLSTPHGGAVAIDAELLSMWRQAVSGQHAATQEHAEARACLAEAGLLERVGLIPSSPMDPGAGHPRTLATVAAVIVVSGPAEREWLGPCLESVNAQSHPCREIVVVDNQSTADLAAWMRGRGLPGRVVSTSSRLSYPAALNVGVAATSADHFLLMNADVQLTTHVVAHLLAETASGVAAVAPKLRFAWAPAFLNGLGNRVPGNGWGTDNAIGQLDLGQFDEWRVVPSGCLATLLVSAKAWRAVGPLDPEYPGYYEDPDWCYRARSQGWVIAVAPRADVLHVFGVSWAVDTGHVLPVAKLERAIVGRWRFTAKVLPGRVALRRCVAYGIEDCRNVLKAVKHRRWPVAQAYWRAGVRVLVQLPWLWGARRRVQRAAVQRGMGGAGSEVGMPASMQWRGLPELTAAAVRDYYGPLLRAGKCRRVPEFTADEVPRCRSSS